MMWPNLFMALCGLALFIFALRFLSQALDQSVAFRLAPAIKKVGKRPMLSLGVGALSTSIFQASSITIVTSMGLLSKRIINLETGIYLILGAAIGTTLKAWFFALELSLLGPLLVITSSFSLIFVRDHYYKKVLEIFFAVGIMFLAWNLIGNELRSWTDTLLVDEARNFFENNFLSLSLFAVIGLFLAMLFQSSSIVVYLSLGLASKGLMPLLMGTAIILGANIGTTATGLLASLQYQREVKRLALAHLVVKFFGSLMALLFLQSFLKTVNLMLFWSIDQAAVATQLAAVHTGLNLLNAFLWLPFTPILIRITNYILPDKERKSLWHRADVQKLLTVVPDQGLIELDKQQERMILNLKVYQDFIFNKIKRYKSHKDRHMVWQPDDFRDYFDSASRILLGISWQNIFHEQINKALKDMSRCEAIFNILRNIETQFDLIKDKTLKRYHAIYIDELIAFEQDLDEIWKMLLSLEFALNIYQKKNISSLVIKKLGFDKKISGEKLILLKIFRSLDELRDRVFELSFNQSPAKKFAAPVEQEIILEQV
jgi:phosphate:Na+ symporter